MAASRGRTLAVLVTLRALEPVLGYTFFSALLSLFFRTDTRKKKLFLAGFFYRLSFGDADFYCISHRFFPFYSFPLLSHWNSLTNFFFLPSFGFRPRFATAAFHCISMAEYPAAPLPSASGYRCLRQLPITGSRIRID